ncbi:trichohyalin-like [Telopea speciosissima]|uniref:trichohyalin-like n=1 Tax=Telopea speciosissima TaxID=54955 RepID=UPI001CC64514|nr:trichohyalin-like [Telopea speciosissima]
MAARSSLKEEDLVVDDGLGYPRLYAKLCRDPLLTPYNHGPPFTFIPYSFQPQEDSRARELDQMFPVIDPEAKPSIKPRIYASLLWKQLNHLGNAGFDPEKFRVDPYGNVLYYHSDSGSPLSWEIDHWFPLSRGGRTVPCNLRILQWQVCKKKRDKLEFLVPWWDLQLGISVNQFLNIFASSNSDFRYRAFQFLFSEGESEELNDSQTAQSHTFPKHFVESKRKIGLAPAAIILSRGEYSDGSSTLRSLDLNRRISPNSSATASRKFLADDNQSRCASIQRFRPSMSKENENPDMATNPYLAIVMARDSLKQKEEAEKMQAEIRKLDVELDEMKQKNEVERVALQDLELVLIKRRRRAEKCRRLAEGQSSYRAVLEKMIRDAMHQSVVYKEQMRLNQAATSALTARLEAQNAICDSSERELHMTFKQKNKVEKQIRPQWELARKRSRMDDTLLDQRDDKTLLYLPGIMPRKHSHKELRVFLKEEQQKTSEASLSLDEKRNQEVEEEKNEPIKGIGREKTDDIPIEEKLGKLEIEEDRKEDMRFSVLHSPEREEDEERRKERGKGNVEKWLKMLLDKTQEGPIMNSPPRNMDAHRTSKTEESQTEDEHSTSKTEEMVRKLNLTNPQKEVKILQFPASENKKGLKPVQEDIAVQNIHQRDDGKRKEQIGEEKIGENMCEKTDAREVSNVGKGIGSSLSFEGKERREKSGKERGLVRSESARIFRQIPSSPSVILGIRKGVDCMRKKPMVIGSDEDGDENPVVKNNFIKSSIKTIKKAVKI